MTFPHYFLQYVNVFQQSDLNKCHSLVKQQLGFFLHLILSHRGQSAMAKSVLSMHLVYVIHVRYYTQST